MRGMGMSKICLEDGYEQQGNRYHDMVTDALHEAAIPDSSRE